MASPPVSTFIMNKCVAIQKLGTSQFPGHDINIFGTNDGEIYMSVDGSEVIEILSHMNWSVISQKIKENLKH